MRAIVPATLANLPPRMQSVLEMAESRLQGSLTALRGRPEWQRLWLASDYALDVVVRDPVAAIALDEAITSEDVPDYALLFSDPAISADEATFMRWLRQQRNREMLRWIWRDVNGLCSVQELTRELSDFADACIELARQRAHAELVLRHGEPIGEESGVAQRLSVIGMGKLGAQELNLSSDIDLIFVYPEAGETAGPSPISNHEFFVRQGQKIIRLLDAQTEDGFVFRVDMRLRPWGDGSALASSFASMETYYEQHGREWERYALIKARICAGDQEQGQQLMRALRPFVFRRYIDFGAFESLREMKAMIEREVRRKGMDSNVKLGRGGIREAEFIVQAFQLIRGGVDKRLQQRELLTVLVLLAETGLLPEPVTVQLKDAYLFLRQVEHRIQSLKDHQTQDLPASPLEQERLAISLGFTDWADFLQCLNGYREQVETQFRDVIVAREAAPDDANVASARMWMADDDELPALMRAAGFREAEESARQLLGLRESRPVKTMQQVGRERLDRLMPMLMTRCLEHDEPDVALTRCLPLVESVRRRSAYMMLLVENSAALGRLVDLCAASPWIADELARFPVLLDELLNARTLFAPPGKAELEAELRQALVRLPEDDIEAQMEALRIFKKGHVLRVAASDITGALPLMKVSDYLTWIAEAVLEEVLWLAWRDLTARHGLPHRADGSPCNPDFIVVGYGKLGGLELGYGSDLDLVFIHDAAPDGETDGQRPLDNASFFARLGQKMIAFLTAATSAGLLYEVDMRLRPSGNSGLLVSSLKSFTNYQDEKAWTWEHQALVRARVVAGDSRLAGAFDAERHAVLARSRDLATLRQEVREMRDKMRGHLSSEAPGKSGQGFDLKHDRGGIVDIEFMVQYAVLAWAHESPELTRYPDNVRILEGLANRGLLPSDAAAGLRDAYLQYRARGHRLALANREAKVSDDEFLPERALVTHWWNELIGG
ncbi:MAG: bifunctional [glutamate--ammonia ligase]-adenylyl-L-tyrosine phosphorylase/[glutamate--ammonia-ligase] adenylyltransferase [Moraxellaceae bacterium]|nr:bifunctional [glutamate--ammonia ligase]-adenylyl-L-tyrosine phosphorylase/[glutamate--ammonia-ligase] adenylyltransferase [Moraxellaceae bacterium]